MRQGELWGYTPVIPRPGMSVVRLVISAEVINADPTVPWVLGVHLVSDDPASLLAPRIGDQGWAVVTTVERVLKSRLGEQVGVASPEEITQVEVALRAALDL